MHPQERQSQGSSSRAGGGLASRVSGLKGALSSRKSHGAQSQRAGDTKKQWVLVFLAISTLTLAVLGFEWSSKGRQGHTNSSRELFDPQMQLLQQFDSFIGKQAEDYGLLKEKEQRLDAGFDMPKPARVLDVREQKRLGDKVSKGWVDPDDPVPFENMDLLLESLPVARETSDEDFPLLPKKDAPKRAPPQKKQQVGSREEEVSAKLRTKGRESSVMKEKKILPGVISTVEPGELAELTFKRPLPHMNKKRASWAEEKEGINTLMGRLSQGKGKGKGKGEAKGKGKGKSKAKQKEDSRKRQQQQKKKEEEAEENPEDRMWDSLDGSTTQETLLETFNALNEGSETDDITADVEVLVDIPEGDDEAQGDSSSVEVVIDTPELQAEEIFEPIGSKDEGGFVQHLDEGSGNDILLREEELEVVGGVSGEEERPSMIEGLELFDTGVQSVEERVIAREQAAAKRAQLAGAADKQQAGEKSGSDKAGEAASLRRSRKGQAGGQKAGEQVKEKEAADKRKGGEGKSTSLWGWPFSRSGGGTTEEGREGGGRGKENEVDKPFLLQKYEEAVSELRGKAGFTGGIQGNDDTIEMKAAD